MSHVAPRRPMLSPQPQTRLHRQPLMNGNAARRRYPAEPSVSPAGLLYQICKAHSPPFSNCHTRLIFPPGDAGGILSITRFVNQTTRKFSFIFSAKDRWYNYWSNKNVGSISFYYYCTANVATKDPEPNILVTAPIRLKGCSWSSQPITSPLLMADIFTGPQTACFPMGPFSRPLFF